MGQDDKTSFREKATQDLNEIKEVYDKLGIKFFLVYGTLLGAVREKNVIVTDHDNDIGLFGEDIYRGEEIYFALKEAGFLVGTYVSLKDPNGNVKRPVMFLTNKRVKTEHIFLFKVGDKRVTWYSTRKNEKTGVTESLVWENDAKHFEYLEETPFLNKKYLVPNHPKELLDLWYKNWGVPSGAQVWGYKCPRFWKAFDPVKEVFK